MKRKFLYVLLILISIVCFAFGLSSCTDYSDTSDNFVYTLMEDGTYSVSVAFTEIHTNDYDASYRDISGDVVIPSEYNDVAVTAISDSGFAGCYSVKSITIPDSITYIGDYAFSECDSLTSVEIPDSVTYLGEGIFYDCSALKSVSIGGEVSYIGDIPFALSSAIESVTISESNLYYKSVDGVLYDTGETTLIYYPCKKAGIEYTIAEGVTTISPKAFAQSANLELIYFPSTLINIGNEAFRECSAEIIWAENSIITEIGNSAFFCYFGKCMVLPDSVTTIGEEAFQYSAITSITIPKNVTSIYYHAGWGGQAAFYGCNHLVEVYNFSALDFTIGEKENGYVAYYAKVIHTTEEKSNLFTVGDYIFYNNGEEYSLIRYIGDDTEITLPVLDGDNITYFIYNYAFLPSEVSSNTGSNYCTITSVEMTDQVISIGKWAFASCVSLISIIFSENLEYIDDYAFAYCSSLTMINIPDSVTYIGENAFNNCTSLAEINLSANITEINCFPNCYALTYIMIPYGVETINGFAFDDSLVSIVVPNSVTSIQTDAFYKCTSLSEIYFDGSASEWKISIGSNNENFSLATIYYYAENGTTTESGNYWYYDGNGNIVTWAVE